ncbi:unnamed protein product [Caenorhabditis angaria]|uniref:TIL domain-containing protein n=1 Tax=Caenorhabditis angaria TaxID=860376 RepID=A0A9P1IY56_9PELO|nr:unnamed protein product [Caenorhabditis angaria]
MKSIFIIVFIFLDFIFHSESQQINCQTNCISPQICDFNTGICRNFRQAFTGPTSISCSTSCPSGTLCDTNTGICRTFRTIG